MRSVYLAGPITGLTFSNATDWRSYAREQLRDFGITGLDPMRGKDYLLGESNILDSYDKHKLSTAHAIYKRDRFDTMRCSAVLVNLLGATRVSIGTIMEIAWADSVGTPIVIVMEPDNMHLHAMVTEAAYVVVPTLDEGLGTIVTLLGLED